MPKDTARERDGDETEDRTVSRRTVLGALGTAGVGLAGIGRVQGRPHAGRGCTGTGAEAPPLPGPEPLYRPGPTVPKLENAGPWRADPLLVSGTDAYDDGEYLFQDFVYDDNGANTSAAPLPPSPRPSSHTFGPMTGDVVYPTDVERYGHNAADLLEFRARLTDAGTVEYRFTLNTMRAPDAAGIALGIDTGPGVATGETDWGYGLGDLNAPADHVLVTWGTGAEFDGSPVASTVDLDRNQITVELPLEPGRAVWRHSLVLGVFDTDETAFVPPAEQPDATTPGGDHGTSPPPVFNVGFRYADQEPLATPNVNGSVERELEEAVSERTGSRGVGYGHWREHAQANALAERDISRFHADVDFGKLTDGVTERDERRTGYLNRLYASNYDLGEGIGSLPTSGEDVLLGDVVPYSLYVPESYDPAEPHDIHVHLHSLSGGYNQYASWTPNFLRQVGEARDTLILTTTGRGPGVPYRDQAELDVFEALRDVLANYNVDCSRLTVSGYSMGGLGTHKLASHYPDLFGAGFSIAGSLGGEASGAVYEYQERIAANQRHVPLLIWQGTEDELAPTPFVLKYHQRLRDLGYRHEFDLFPGYDHLAFGYLDEWGPAAEFLDDATVTRNPAQVTYRAVPATDNADYDLRHDGAYWVSDVEPVEGAPDGGLVDARSLAFGEAAPVVRKYEEPGEDPKPHVKRGVRWADPLVDPDPENAIDVSLTAVDSVTLWTDAAQIDPRRPLTLAVESDGSATVTLAGSHGRVDVAVPEGTSEHTVRLCGTGRLPPRLDVRRSDDGTVFAGGQTDQVDLHVDASEAYRVRDAVPSGWSVVGGDVRTYDEDGVTYAEFLVPARDETRTYFVEAPTDPARSGPATFGPVEVSTDDGWASVPGTTDTNVGLGGDGGV